MYEKNTEDYSGEKINISLLYGANIRFSSMDLSILSVNKVSLITLDNKYLPTAIVLPFEGHTRQSILMFLKSSAIVLLLSPDALGS